jgi:creatinine amidohydrolase
MARLLGELTTDEVEDLLSRPPSAVLVPVGSVEPHGPHLPLATDTLLGETAALRACEALEEQGIRTAIAPSVAYGVTDFAEGFAGAVSVPAGVLTALLRAIVERLRSDGWTHVCLVSNHLEPAHDAAVREAIRGISGSSVASPLTKRWGRTLSDEFKRAECHAGRYETSLVLAAGGRVASGYQELPRVGVNLAAEIAAGRNRFRDIGMDRAYTGSPAEATREEGDALYGKLVAMIVGEVTEGLRG